MPLRAVFLCIGCMTQVLQMDEAPVPSLNLVQVYTGTYIVWLAIASHSSCHLAHEFRAKKASSAPMQRVWVNCGSFAFALTHPQAAQTHCKRCLLHTESARAVPHIKGPSVLRGPNSSSSGKHQLNGAVGEKSPLFNTALTPKRARRPWQTGGIRNTHKALGSTVR